MKTDYNKLDEYVAKEGVITAIKNKRKLKDAEIILNLILNKKTSRESLIAITKIYFKYFNKDE